jgi:hypothetical protein
MTADKPRLKIIGEDGSAFAILGKAFRQAREAGWTQEQIEDYKARATAGDYNNLLRVTMGFFDVE